MCYCKETSGRVWCRRLTHMSLEVEAFLTWTLNLFLSFVFLICHVQPCCTMVRSLQGSVCLRLVWEQVCSWLRSPYCCRKEVQGTCWRQVLPPCCPLLGSSEVLRFDLPAWVVKVNIQCLFFGSHLEGEIPHAFSLWISAGIWNLLFRK